MNSVRFFKDNEHREQFLANLKLIECPHCEKTAYLICNGLLKGNDPDQQGPKQLERGQRIFCSNRGNRKGCGRSFSVLEPTVLPNQSIDTTALVLLLIMVQKCAGCIYRAFNRCTKWSFSLSSTYRVWRKIDRWQTELRHRLCQCTGPPACSSTEPRLQLLAHLQAAFQTDDPIRNFQAHFQTPFLPGSENQIITSP